MAERGPKLGQQSLQLLAQMRTGTTGMDPLGFLASVVLCSVIASAVTGTDCRQPGWSACWSLVRGGVQWSRQLLTAAWTRSLTEQVGRQCRAVR